MLTEEITVEEVKKIFPNRALKDLYLRRLYGASGFELPNRFLNNEIDNKIIETWDYNVSKCIIRAMFRETEKYLNGRESGDKAEALLADWNAHNLGDLEWPFKAMNFDGYVHKINVSDFTEEEKDRILAEQIIKFRRIKDITAKRNDYLEYLIFESSEDIIPTLGHRVGVDFYIKGLPYDQKVSRGVTKKFIQRYGNGYRRKAIENPEEVAQCLYEEQDSERFGAEPRLLIVYLDNDLTSDDLHNSLERVNFDEPIELRFSYNRPGGGATEYQTTCFVILLYKEEQTV